MNGQLEQLRNWGAVLLLVLTSAMLADAATSTGVSPISTVDTRSAPYLQPMRSPTNGAFALNIQGLFGRNARLEISTNLTSWQTLTNLTGTNATIYFEDRTTTNFDRRFYRAVLE